MSAFNDDGRSWSCVSAPSKALRKTINAIVKAGQVSVSDVYVGIEKFYMRNMPTSA